MIPYKKLNLNATLIFFRKITLEILQKSISLTVLNIEKRMLEHLTIVKFSETVARIMHVKYL